MATKTASPVMDFLHHINRKSKARHPSPLKDIIKFMGFDGMISLAGGLPHPSLFPVQQAKFDCLAPAAPLPDYNTARVPEDDIVALTLGRGKEPGDLDLTQFLQYGSGTGNAHLLELCKALTETVHSPPCAYECLLHPGNTNAWAKVVGMLCEDDDFVLVEEYTYPSAQALWIPLGIRAAPVVADGEGISAGHLRGLLEGWDEKSRGARRPRRRKEIYDVCVEFDIILVEDDPYYFLQYPHYKLSSQQTQPTESPLLPTRDFLSTLTPSFLSHDTQGRVIRLESLSKTLFPGLRLGYFIANPIFAERLLRATEVETQDPAGLSQAFVLALLNKWGAFHENFTVVPAKESPIPKAEGLVVCIKTQNGTLKPVFSFIDPTAGMFIWSKFYFTSVPRFLNLQSDSRIDDPEQSFATELWKAWADELVLLTPGSYYHPWQGKDKITTSQRGAEAGTAHFRFSFATPTKEQIFSGVERVRRVVEKYWV
ncbi:hypothetical protein BDV06DRAFT_211412 [Aspergillus oleicola]